MLDSTSESSQYVSMTWRAISASLLCVAECHEGKALCGQCLVAAGETGAAGAGEGHGEGGRLAPLDLKQFQATALEYKVGRCRL